MEFTDSALPGLGFRAPGDSIFTCEACAHGVLGLGAKVRRQQNEQWSWSTQQIYIYIHTYMCIYIYAYKYHIIKVYQSMIVQ